MKLKYFISIILLANYFSIKSQALAFDLIIAQSTNGINWTNNALFQDSSGVPSVVQHTNGTLYGVFQWFCAPATQTNPAFDKIAIKSSTNNGVSWTNPQLINIGGFPGTYKRPFDPTIVSTDNGGLRIYFSSSKTGTLMALDSTVHTYSAFSPDGNSFTWEPGVRVLVDDSIVIDPAVAKLGSAWHFSSPRAFPSAGAHHFISSDGLAWTRTTTISSDNNHNWTGNFMIDGSDMKFYGTPSPQTGLIWYKSTSDGYNFSAYQNCTGVPTTTGIQADPSVVKLSNGTYLMIYVSTLAAVNGFNELTLKNSCSKIYPNPSVNYFNLDCAVNPEKVNVYDLSGKLILELFENTSEINHSLEKGIYFVETVSSKGKSYQKLLVD